jgi:hypothetical protein
MTDGVWCAMILCPLPVPHVSLLHARYTQDTELIADKKSSGGIELVSPTFKAFTGSTWRSNVEAVWNFIQQNYKITGSGLCATHIHISIDPDHTLRDIKRLAQAVIQFEPALEALVPPERRHNVFAKSNWLDSPGLGRKGLSRRDSITAVGQASDFDQLMALLQPLHELDREFAWNFYPLFTDTKTIEFRKPPVSVTQDEALSWAEFAISFVHASIRCESSNLLKIPSNIGGLRWFLQSFNVPGMNEPHRLQRLWQGKDPGEALEPKPQIQGSFPENMDLAAKLQATVEEDERLIREFAKTAQEPYW